MEDARQKNAEKQRKYRARAKAGGGKCLSIVLSVRHDFMLNELQRRFKLSRRETLTKLITDEFNRGMEK